MGAALEQFGYGIANNVIGTGMGLLMANWADRRQLRQQEKLNKLQIAGSKELTEFQNAKQMEIWEKTNYKAQMEKLKEAGLNPGLIYGSAGQGGTLGGAIAGVQGAAAPAGGKEIQEGMGIAMQNALMQAQIENIKADTENKKSDTVGKRIQQAGQLTENEIKLIDKLIKEIDKTIKEMDFDDMWAMQTEVDDEGTIWTTENNEVRQARRAAAKANYEKTKSEAQLIVDMYKNGTLAKMTQAELDNKLKEIGIKEGTITTQKLENAMLEMDKKMAESLGLGKDSKGWVDTGIKVIMQILMKFIRQR